MMAEKAPFMSERDRRYAAKEEAERIMAIPEEMREEAFAMTADLCCFSDQPDLLRKLVALEKFYKRARR